jgi:flagellar hook-length control protein FliK
VGTVAAARGAEGAAAPASTAAPLSDQLAAKLGEALPALRAAGSGRHVLTLAVDPEHFGPVKVVAHISAESVRVELVGATDQAREQLKAALPDLRRDLAQAGLQDLGLGEGSTGGDRTGSREGSGRASGAPGTAGTATGAEPADRTTPTVRTPATAGGLDLLV